MKGFVLGMCYNGYVLGPLDGEGQKNHGLQFKIAHLWLFSWIQKQ